MERIREKLNRAQSKRLFDIVEEYKNTNDFGLRKVSKVTGVSLGRLGMLNPCTASYEPCSVGVMLQICKSLDANPYYVLENKKPKYAKWENAFRR